MSPSPRRMPASDVLRPLLVLALLVVVAVAAAAARHAPATSGVGVHGAGGVVVAFGIVVLVVASVMLLTGLRVVIRAARRRRRDDDEFEIVQERHDTVWQRLGALLALLIVVGFAVGLAIALGHVTFAPGPHATPTGAHPTAAPLPPRTPRSSKHGGAGGAVIALAVVAAVVVVAICVYLAVRAIRRRDRIELGTEPEQEPGAAGVLRSAAAALASPADPRAAILACYRTMEQRLAAAGTDRRVADTPEELLDRSARSGLLLPDAAGRLAALFREARFSTHPMTEAHRGDAQAALDAVVHTVARRR